MDFEFTDRNRNVIAPDSPFQPPVKRSHNDMSMSAPPFPQPNPYTPSFGTNSNVPFLFKQAIPPSMPDPPWQPRSPMQQHQPEINDVSMDDASPPKLEMPVPITAERAVATGALSRVFRSRQKQKFRTSRRGGRSRMYDEDADETDEEDLTETDEEGELTASTPHRRRGLQKSHSEPVTTTANHNHHYTFHVPTPQLSHSEIPYILLGYLQFFFNLSLVITLLYLMYCFFRAVQKDVEQKMVENTLDTLQEISACAQLYNDNYCADKPSPIIALQCQEWKACMARDATIVGRTRLLAQLIGEVIDGFMEPITWRTMVNLIFTTTSLAMGIAFINTLLMFYRGRHAPQSMPVPTATPSFQGFGAQSLPPYWGQAPAPLGGGMSRHEGINDLGRGWSTSGDVNDVSETPSRRRKISDDEDVKLR
ncbi:Di-sulfide bridge nucleocytoplasmic transport domain-containing protein [Hysterangium stoloniferum]|nr:Di-sulfide bridge nucleocytoplasmic transport domain-containing protein [Hysterangium stoloniferum]